MRLLLYYDLKRGYILYLLYRIQNSVSSECIRYRVSDFLMSYEELGRLEQDHRNNEI